MYNHNKAQQSKNRVHISWDTVRESLNDLSQDPKVVSLVVFITLYNRKAEILPCDAPPCSPRISTNQKWLHSVDGRNVFRHKYLASSANALQNYFCFFMQSLLYSIKYIMHNICKNIHLPELPRTDHMPKCVAIRRWNWDQTHIRVYINSMVIKK